MKRSRRRFAVALLAALAILAALSFPPACPQERPSRAKPLTLRVVASPFEPFAFQAEGEARGLDVDLLSLVCSARGWTYEIEWVPFDEVFRRLRAGTADMAIGAIYATPARAQDFLLTEPYLQTGLVVVTRPSVHFSSVGEMDGLRVGVKRGATGQTRAESLRIERGLNLTIVPFETTEASFGALLHGRVDAVFNDYLNSVYLISTAYSGKLTIVSSDRGPLFLTRDSLVFPMRKGLETERRAFDETLDQLRRGGVLDHVGEKWLPYQTPIDLGRIIRWSVAAAVSAVLLFTFILWINRRRVRSKVMRDAELRTRDLIDQSPISILIHRSGTIVYANRVFLNTFGLSGPEEVLPESIMAFAAPSERERLGGFISARDSGAQAPDSYESTCLRKNGELFPVQVKVARIQMADGSASLLFIEDITARKSAMEALKKSESDYRGLFENAHDAIIIFDPEGREEILEVNQRACELYGFDHDEFVGMSLEALSKNPERGKEHILKTLEKGFFRSFETLQFKRSGEEIILEVNASIVDFRGRSAILSVNRDITKRRRAEEALKESEERFRTLAETTSAAIMIYQGEVFRYANPATSRLTGFSLDEILSMKFWELVHPDHREMVRQRGIDRQRGKDVPSRYEFRAATRDGRILWVDFTAGRTSWEGHPAGVATAFDITERKRAEEALKDSEACFRTLMESANDAIFIADAETGKILDANQRAQELVGRSLEELRLMTQADLHPPEERGHYRAIFEKHVGAGSMFESGLYAQHSDGRRIPVDISANVVEIGGRPLVQGIFRDMTGPRKIELALRESETRFRTLAETTSASIMIFQDDRFVYINPAAEALSGYSLEEARRMSFWSIVHPDHEEMVKARGRARQRGEEAPAHYEIKIVAKGGEERWISLSAGRLFHQGRPAGIVTAFDITMRKRAEEDLSRRNRELLSLLASAQAMGGFLDLEAAAKAICQAAITAYGYRMAWIGLVVPESTEVRVLASAGHDDGYTQKVRVRWDLSERAQGPCGKAINTRVPVVQRPEDPEFGPWREEALKRGYAAICAFPLIHEDTVRGTLTLYSATPDAFDSQALSGLEIFARQATMAVVNASLYEEAKRIIEELGSVNDELMASRGLIEKQLRELQRGRVEMVASEARFRQLAETATAAIFIIKDFRYRYVNAFTEKETGYSREELLAMHSLQLVHPDHHELVKSVDFVSRDAGEGPSRHELKIVRKDGEVRWLDISVSVIEFEGQRSIIGTAYDVTDRKNAEQSLQESERRYRGLAETVSDWIWEVDDQLRYTYCSPRIRDLLGYEPSEVVGKSPFDLMPEEEADRLRPVVADRVKNREELHVLENVNRHKNGSLRILETSAVPTFDPEGRFTGYQGIDRDITERRRIFETLRRSEEEFRRTFDLSPVGAVMVGLDYHFLRCNGAFCRFLGYTEEDLAGKTFLDVTHPEDKGIGMEEIRAVAQGDLGVANFQKRYLRKDGGVVWGELTVRLVGDAEGRPAHFLTIVQDITRRNKALAALSESEARLKEIVEHSANLFYSHTSSHVLTYVSPQSRHFLGCEPQEAMVRWTEFVTENPVNARGYDLTQRAIDTGERQPPYELELKTKDGRLVWVQVNETPVVREGKTVAIVGALTDITGLKRAQLALKETGENLARLRAASPLPIIALDPEGKVQEWNLAAEAMTGWSINDAKGRICPLLPPDRLEPLKAFIEEAALRGQATMWTDNCRRRDGSIHSVRATGVCLHGPDGDVSGILAFLTEED